MAWYSNAVFYHIHPLSLCGCGHESTGTKGSYFGKLAEWAEHAKKMGCNAIYIGPIFQTETHGYGIVDYYKVDPRLGTNEDFKEWVAKCHSMGMRVVVDGVFNHVGRGFFAFLNLKKNKRNSAYKEWFSKINFNINNEFDDGFGYENWGGYNQLVKLNLLNPWLNDYHFDTVRFWISEFNIDGIRMDAIEELDYDFIKDLRKVAQEAKPDFFMMGEIEDGDCGRWINDRLLHSAANNEMQGALIFAHNDCGYPVVAQTARKNIGQCPDAKLYTYVDNYDVPRIHEKLNRPEHRYLVTLLQYTLYGIPSLYCGSEFSVGIPKRKVAEEELDKPMELADFKNAYTRDEITHLHCLLGRANQQFKVLAQGRYKELLLAGDQYAFARVLGKAAMVTVVNSENRLLRMEIPLPINAKKAIDMLSAVIDWEKAPEEGLDISGCRELAIQDNELYLDLPANGGMLIWVTG